MSRRLSVVLKILYLVFNAGYNASEGKNLLRSELCDEGLHLARLLCKAMPAEPEAHGLLALMLAQHSRSPARCGTDGGMILLADQDRGKWDQGKIEEASQTLLSTLAMGRSGAYQLQAAIACLHTEAQRYEDTDWLQILLLYDSLLFVQPSPVIGLNRAVALSMARGTAIEFQAVEAIAREGELAIDRGGTRCATNG
jgi:RNA polymerase sigma-70 factor (ECF subfamily)